MLYIRADGNTEIGMGHVMRCLSVAEAVAKKNPLQRPVFITADNGCRAMIEDRGFSVIVLDTDYKDMISELPLIEQVLCRECVDTVLFVDSYQADCAYYQALKKFGKVVCFEDMGQAYPADLLINYNIYAPSLTNQYRAPDLESQTEDKYPKKVLLGVKYMPLREVFLEPAEYKIKDKVTDVIITTGGSDPCFAAAVLADVLINDKAIAEQKIHLHIISGPFNRFVGELKRRYQQDSAHQHAVEITIHENVKDMRALFLKSDVVITATGSTIYEVSALGVPMIVFYFAENQRQGAEALALLTDIVNAGCFTRDAKAVADRTKEVLKKCIINKSYRERLNRQEVKLVDGRGAHRIAKQLIELEAEHGYQMGD